MPFFLLSPEQNREGGRTAALSAGELGQGGRHGEGQKHEGVEGFRFPLLPRAGAKRGGSATRADGRRRLRQRRWGTGRRARGGGWSCGGDGLREEPIYRPGKAVGRAGRAGQLDDKLGGH